ncbi:MAG: ABC transporter substrate-binding protein [Bacillota bacterium]|nr:ABC transporter substrate-binding protein [Bacillota bacterium]
MRRGPVYILICIVMIIAFVFTACGKSASGADTTKLTTVKVAFDDAVTEAGVILADKLGYFEKQGIKMEYVRFNSGSDELSAIISNQVDVSRGIINAALFNASSQGFNVKVVADGAYNIPGKGFFQIALKKGLGEKVKDFKDLKGLKIAIASRGSINELFVEKALEKGGLSEKDISFVVVDSFPDMLTAVANGNADATMQLEPLITKGVDEGILEWWKDPDTYATGEEMSVLMYSPNLVKKPELGKKFMVAYLKGVRAYCDALVYGNKDQAKIVDILAKNTSVNDPATLLKMKTPGLEPNGKLLKEGIASDQQWYMNKGLVKSPADIGKLIDESYAKYAVGILGEYKQPK